MKSVINPIRQRNRNTNTAITISTLRPACLFFFSPELFKYIENDDPNAALTAADYNLANGQMGWTSTDAEDKSVSKFVTYTVEIPANTAAGKYELKVVGVTADKNYGQDAVLTKGQHDSTLTLTVKEKTTATGYTAELSVDTAKSAVTQIVIRTANYTLTMTPV